MDGVEGVGRMEEGEKMDLEDLKKERVKRSYGRCGN